MKQHRWVMGRTSSFYIWAYKAYLKPEDLKPTIKHMKTLSLPIFHNFCSHALYLARRIIWRKKKMVRRYAMKAGKKRKQREERYDREEEEVEEEVAEQPVEDEAIAKKAMTERTSDAEEEEEKEEVNELEGIPIDPSDLKVANKPKVIFILERASLEVAKVGKVFNL